MANGRRSKTAARTRGRRANSSSPASSKPRNRPDPSDTDDTEVRFIQPFQATKAYLCPGCGRTITQGQGHMVAVPRHAPDLRRHWHRGCWVNRHTRY